MDYEVAFYQQSWPVHEKIRTADVIDKVINDRDAIIRKLRLPNNQEDNVDHISTGIWLKVRTDHARQSQTTTAFASVQDRGLHRPVPFSFTRSPLKETQIRLIRLLRGNIQDELRAELLVVNLDKAPAYSALSYIWGSPEAHSTISLGNHSYKTERITRNLDLALRQIRSPDSACLLWVDALCIDQNNTEERSYQVQIMGNIFANAAQVIVWLGLPTEDSEFGMRALQWLAEGKGFDLHPPWEVEPPELLQRGLRNALNSPWFNRVWTVQEAALSSQRTLMISGGQGFVTWPATVEAVSLFIRGLKYAAVTAHWTENGFGGSSEHGLQGVDLTGIINLLNQQLHQIQRRQGIPVIGLEPDLLDIAYEVKDKECTDPRDRLYAIVGLAFIRGADVQLRPDYTKSLHEVQEDFRKLLHDAATGGANEAP